MNLSLWLVLRPTYQVFCKREYFLVVPKSEENGEKNSKDLNEHKWQVYTDIASSLGISSQRTWQFLSLCLSTPFLAKFIIVQEAGEAGNWDIFCGMAGYENTSTLYNNDPQLDTREESVKKLLR